MNNINISNFEYYYIVRSIFSHELRKRRLITQWGILKDYLLQHIGDSKKENHIEQIEGELDEIKEDEAAWSHLKDCIYLQVFPYIPQVKVV